MRKINTMELLLFPDIAIIFNKLVNGDSALFEHGLITFIDITTTLAAAT